MTSNIDRETYPVILLGASGLVGTAIHNKLYDLGYKDIRCPTHDELNLLNYNDAVEYIRKAASDGVEGLIMAAGYVGGLYSNMSNNLSYFALNMTMGYNVITACAGYVPNVIYLGSSCIYPNNIADRKIKETDLNRGPLELTNEGYALAKISCSYLCKYVNESWSNHRYTTIMPCNLYGINDNYNPARSHVIPALIHKFESSKNCVRLLGDGLAIREFLFANDLADLVCKVLEDTSEDRPDIINAGSEEGISIRDLVYLLQDLIPQYKQKSIIWDSTKPSGTKVKIMDSSLSRDRYGWRATTPLMQGLMITIDDYRHSIENGSIRK